MQTVTEAYLMGIKEGRSQLKQFGLSVNTKERIENLKSTLEGFDRSSSVGQMLLGELHFWENQNRNK
jgi:hypothetical protein